MSSVKEVELLADELHRNGVCIGQIKDKRFTRAFLRRGLNDASLKVFLAIANHQVVGWTIAIRNSRRYWKRFLLPHPLWAMRILACRLRGTITKFKLAKGSHTEQDVVSQFHLGRVSHESHLEPDEIATHIDITVLGEYRQQGIATKLEQMLADELKRSGVTQLKGVIAEWNDKSQFFHEKRGWVVLGKSEGFLQIRKTL